MSGGPLGKTTTSSNLKFKANRGVTMSSDGLTIGDLAKQAGTTAPTVRYYEAINLLPKARRQGGRQRRYSDADVQLLSFICRCRDFGFPVEQVRRLIELVRYPDKPCGEVRDIALEHLTAIRSRLLELQELEGVISHFVTQCDACDDDAKGPCVPLTELARVSSPGKDASRSPKFGAPTRRIHSASRQ